MWNWNSTKHRTTGVKPSNVNESNGKTLLSRAYSCGERKSMWKPKFAVRHLVRISKYKTVFEKGYTPAWSTEIFVVEEVKKTTQEHRKSVDETAAVKFKMSAKEAQTLEAILNMFWRGMFHCEADDRDRDVTSVGKVIWYMWQQCNIIHYKVL